MEVTIYPDGRNRYEEMTFTEFKKAMASERKHLPKCKGNTYLVIRNVETGDFICDCPRKNVKFKEIHGRGYIYTPDGIITFNKGRHFKGACNYEFVDNYGTLYDLFIEC